MTGPTTLSTPTGDKLDRILDAVEAGAMHHRTVYRRYGIDKDELFRLLNQRAAFQAAFPPATFTARTTWIVAADATVPGDETPQ